MTMRALTVRQPYADSIVHGTKRTENRTRPIPPKYLGTTILIHAGAAPHPQAPIWGPRPDARKAIIGTTVLASCHQATDGCCAPWGEVGTWHWVLDDVRALETPVPCPGALGLWTPPPAALDAVQAQREAVRP